MAEDAPDLEHRVRQLETDLAAAQSRIAHLTQWVETTIYAADYSSQRQTEAARLFLRRQRNNV